MCSIWSIIYPFALSLSKGEWMSIEAFEMNNPVRIQTEDFSQDEEIKALESQFPTHRRHRHFPWLRTRFLRGA